jgi:hypothetical protein
MRKKPPSGAKIWISFLGGIRLTRVAQQVPAYSTKRRSEGAADKTINNELEVLIKMLRLANENNKLMRLPVIHKLKVNNVRQGFFLRKSSLKRCAVSYALIIR